MSISEFRSYDDQTGMLQDIDEVREAGVRLAWIIKRMLTHPVLSMLIPRGLVIDTATYVLSIESMLRHMPQAEYYRLLASTIGIPSGEIEVEIKKYGISEVYPMSHPNATILNLPPLDPNDPFIKQSAVLSAIAEMQAKDPTFGKKALPKEETIALSPELEAFLGSLTEIVDQLKESVNDTNEGDSKAAE